MTIPHPISVTTGPFRDCFQVHQAGHTTSGMYLLKTDSSDRLVQAWCEHGLDNGGWTVLQRRRDGSVNFFRNWENYKVSICPSVLLSPGLLWDGYTVVMFESWVRCTVVMKKLRKKLGERRD